MEINWWLIKSRLVWRKGAEWNQLLADEYSIYHTICPADRWISEHEFWEQYFPLNQGFNHPKAS